MSGIYVHIPFCSRRCSYCDFFFITNQKLIPDFLDSLRKEIRIRSGLNPADSFDTIFFGGGTPSLIGAKNVGELIALIRDSFNVESNSEISLEANPEDLDAEFIKALRSAGVNRLSIGVQSFIDDELEFLTRQHSPAQAEDAVRAASEIIGNSCVDLICSLPSQTQNSISYSIGKAIDCGAAHISAYTLTYEDRTLLTKQMKEGSVVRNTPEAEAELYMHVCRELQRAGFNHYEVSNFALPGRECRHNRKYWSLRNYIGLGPSAHSFSGAKRWNNVSSVGFYTERLAEGMLPVESETELSDDEIKEDYIMLALRAEGVFFKEFGDRFGKDFREEYSNSIRELCAGNFAEKSHESFRLTLRGYIIADEIIARYF